MEAHEPRAQSTRYVDGEGGQQILDLLSGLRKDFQTTLVLVTHDPEVAARADRKLTLFDGRWQEV